jgi:glycosyltransferase involved in cell wall biosynthesis
VKILIGLVGRFHAVELCKGFISLNLKPKIITTVPGYIMKAYLDKKYFQSIGMLGLINHFRFIFGARVGNLINLYIHKIFAILLIKEINTYDLFITWAGNSLEFYKSNTLKKNLKKKITILECGSTHILHKVKVMKRLYRQNNFKFIINKDFIKRELEEYKLAKYVVVPSNYAKKTFKSFGINENKIFVNPYGVDKKVFYIDNLYTQQKTKIKILFCGNASLRKGFHLLIDASKYFSNMNIQLIHIGSVEREIRSYMRKKNINSFVFLGQKKQKELFKFYNQADALILPSLEEGLALVQLQSLACGTPIISSDQAGVDDIMKNSSVYLGEKIKTVSKEGIADSINLFLKNKKKVQKKAISQYCEKNFSIDSYIQRYQKFINDKLNK